MARFDWNLRKNSVSRLGWNRHVFCRSPHGDIAELLTTPMGSSGIYLIGCAKEIVYVGQSLNLSTRPIESLGRYYHRVPDATLPWSLALAPCVPEEMNERESTAIRRYAPKFNTSIPNVPKSQGRMPDVIGVAAVFQDQDGPCGAFDTENLKRQTEKARVNLNPSWRRKRTRRKSVRVEPRLKMSLAIGEVGPREDFAFSTRFFAVLRRRPLPFKINLCEGGDVITRDGVIIGVWILGGSREVLFLPNDAYEPRFRDENLGRLCNQIREWYEADTGDVIS